MLTFHVLRMQEREIENLLAAAATFRDKEVIQIASAVCGCAVVSDRGCNQARRCWEFLLEVELCTFQVGMLLNEMETILKPTYWAQAGRMLMER